MEIIGGKYEAFPMDSGYNKFMMLKIKNITKEDFGFYKCIAKNSLGETDGIIKLDGNFLTLVDWFKTAPVGENDWKRWKTRKNKEPFYDLREFGSVGKSRKTACQLSVKLFWGILQKNTCTFYWVFSEKKYW